MTPRKPKRRPAIPGLERARAEALIRKHEAFLDAQLLTLQASLNRLVESAERLADPLPDDPPPVVWVQ